MWSRSRKDWAIENRRLPKTEGSCKLGNHKHCAPGTARTTRGELLVASIVPDRKVEPGAGCRRSPGRPFFTELFLIFESVLFLVLPCAK